LLLRTQQEMTDTHLQNNNHLKWMTPKKLLNSNKNCFICSVAVNSKQCMCVFKSTSKGTSSVDLQGLINKTLDIYVTVYLNSDVAVCIKCYKSSVKYQKAEEHVQEIKTELKTAYSESDRHVKQLQCTEDELTPGTSAKKHLLFLNKNPTTCSSSNLKALSSALPRLTTSPIGKPQKCLFGNGTFSLVRSDICFQVMRGTMTRFLGYGSLSLYWSI